MTGDEIREARERAGLTQAQLGKAVGVSLRTIGNWERGETPVAPRMQARLMQALNAERDSEQRDPLGNASDVELLAEIAKRFARTAEQADRTDADDLDPAAMAEVVHRFGRRTDDREDRDPWFLTEEEQEMLAARRGPSEGKDFRRRHDAEAEAPDADPGDHIA